MSSCTWTSKDVKQEILSEILERGKDDWLDFAEILWVVRSQTQLPEPAVIDMSVELIGEMLEQHLAEVGDLQKSGDTIRFSPWGGQPAEIAERIQRNVADLSHRPGIGDVCWVSTT